MTTESPRGVKANLLRSYEDIVPQFASLKAVTIKSSILSKKKGLLDLSSKLIGNFIKKTNTKQEMEFEKKKADFDRLLFALCLFHAVI